jgi:hypothetical protein
MVSQGVSMLWSAFTPAKKAAERLPKRISDLVEEVSKKPLPKWQKSLLVEVMADDASGEDIEVPYLLVSERASEKNGLNVHVLMADFPPVNTRWRGRDRRPRRFEELSRDWCLN